MEWANQEYQVIPEADSDAAVTTPPDEPQDANPLSAQQHALPTDRDVSVEEAPLEGAPLVSADGSHQEVGTTSAALLDRFAFTALLPPASWVMTFNTCGSQGRTRRAWM